MRAALVLALERSGDEAGAVEALLSTVGPLDSATKAALLAMSLESLSEVPSDPLRSLDAPRASAIARAVGIVWRAIASADDFEARHGLIAAFEGASPDIVRLLSDLVTRSMLFEQWAKADAFDDLGRVLDRLRPTRGAPTLESGLPCAIGRAWHYRRLGALLGPITSLEPLLAVMPESLRFLLMSAQLCVIVDNPEQPASDELAEAWANIAQQAPEPKLTKHEPLALVVGVAPALTGSQAREAVARLSEPERAVIRSLLEHYGDSEGLAALSLDAKR